MNKKKQRLSGLLLATAALGLALVGWAWFSLFSPWGYAPPAGLQPIEQGSTHQVFVYGTLRLPLVRRLVIGRSTPTQPAILPGFSQHGLDLTPRPGAFTEGETLTVGADELARLDRYERLGVRYQRNIVTLADGATAWVYTRLLDDET